MGDSLSGKHVTHQPSLCLAYAPRMFQPTLEVAQTPIQFSRQKQITTVRRALKYHIVHATVIQHIEKYLRPWYPTDITGIS